MTDCVYLVATVTVRHLPSWQLHRHWGSSRPAGPQELSEGCDERCADHKFPADFQKLTVLVLVRM